jgi:energy-coupling factor transporter ATP-binding protein EcfA2
MSKKNTNTAAQSHKKLVKKITKLDARVERGIRKLAKLNAKMEAKIAGIEEPVTFSEREAVHARYGSRIARVIKKLAKRTAKRTALAEVLKNDHDTVILDPNTANVAVIVIGAESDSASETGK